jgi:hypothetical protein
MASFMLPKIDFLMIQLIILLRYKFYIEGDTIKMHMFTMLERIHCRLKNHTQMHAAQIKDLSKMDQAIKRMDQAQGICLLRTDYLENT